MRETQHFKLPKILLLPNVDRLAAQQGLFTLTTPNIQLLSTLFRTFSLYINPSLQLNPGQRQSLYNELQELKNNPTTPINEIRALVKKIKKLRKRYQQQQILTQQQGSPIFLAYENEDLTFIASKILKQIANYIYNAKKELRHCKPSSKKEHPISTFTKFIQDTENLLQQHQFNIADCMLLRLEQAEADNNVNTLSRQNFIDFHQYIAEHGNQKALKRLFWISQNVISLNEIIHPKKPRWPKWFFRGNNMLYRAFGDTYHQVSLSLQIKQLNAIHSNELKRFATVKQIHQSLTQEIQRLDKLRNKLFRLFHFKERARIAKRIQQLSTYQKQAAELHSTQTKILEKQEPHDTQKPLIIRSIPTKTTKNLESLCQQIMTQLHYLLHKKTLISNYLEQFAQLKTLSEQLPDTRQHLSIKRLCTAGPNIPYVLNEFINAILAFTNHEIKSIHLINPLLLDIINADLIQPEKKTILLQLIDATLFDPENLLPNQEKQRLFSVKKCLNGAADDTDWSAFIDPLSSNTNRLIGSETKTEPQTKGDNTYGPTI